MKIGAHISGRYKIIGKIGTGGMANVYLAEDLILEREVAVKMMSLDFQEDQRSLKRFQREALSTAELDHPNIVNIYDVGEGNQPYIVMEYISGMDLKQYIRENHPVPYYKVIDIMGQVLDGVSYAHENNVIHRDIKPHNILINHDNHVKLTDFGIAVALTQNSITQTNSLLGSVQYMSPEQARGNVVTRQSDIYSLGIVLYELLAGTVPFDGESAVSIALKHFQAPIPGLREFDSRLPQALENVVLKATAKEPKNRYATAKEMKEDLETVLTADRRNESVFVPMDLDDEKTMVLDAIEVNTGEEVSSVSEKNTNEKQPKKDSNKEKKTKNKKKKKLWWLLLIPLIAVIVAFAYLSSRPNQVIIPKDLIGMTLEEATERLEEQMLELGEVNEQSNDDMDEGLVFQINPKTGSTVLEGSEVDLYISLGEEPYELGDYTGKDYEEVRAKLTELGFEVNKEEQTSGEVESGKIIAQDLAAGEKVIISDSTINFSVSTGKPVVYLRDLHGYSHASVDDYVKREGLNLTIEEKSSEEVALGLVISQKPEKGTSINVGDRITVVFSIGPKEISDIAFSKQIQLPYDEKLEDPKEKDPKEKDPKEEDPKEEDPKEEDPKEEDPKEEDSKEEDLEDEGSEDEDPKNEELKKLPNKIEIYIEDLDNNIDNVAHELTITSDESYFLNFTVAEGESASYRVLRDGKEIIKETVSP